MGRKKKEIKEVEKSIPNKPVAFPKGRKAEIEAAKVKKVTMFGQDVAPRFEGKN